VLDERFGAGALAGLEGFSHIEVVFHFGRVGADEITAGAGIPVAGPIGRWGIFSQRGRNRPNRIGVGICRLLSVEDRTLKVRGLDAIDGTPVLDIKPVMKGFLPREMVEPAWASELMKEYW
jgi:tRNA (Thr-GGU) A37 N-methylase